MMAPMRESYEPQAASGAIAPSRRVNVVFHRIAHHAAHSGYAQIVDHLARRLPVRRLPARVPGLLPRAAADELIERAEMSFYNRQSLGHEIAAAQCLLRHRSQICHLLYGEDTYCHLATVSPALRLRRGRLVCTYHQPPAFFEAVVRTPDRARRLRQLSAIVVPSSAQAAYFGALVGDDRVFVVPHGVDTGFFRPPPFRPPSSGVRCVVVGSWLRDFALLGEVIERVRAVAGQVTFDVVAGDEARAHLEGRPGVVTRSGISDPELLSAYQQADLCVLPLLDSTANNSLLEALACGLPVVVTGCGGVCDYVDAQCAILTSPGEAGDMAEAILRLAADRSRRVEMGRASRRVATALDWEVGAERLVGVYAAVGS
jgi:glycosyltransferase involved in cell wall biosynthesis